MKRLTTFLMALLLTWIGANAQIVSGTDYVIVNKEANQFLYGSYNWGCEASIGSKPVTFTVTGSGNVYTLQANQWEGEHYVGADFYTDKSSSNAGSISITAVTDDEGYYYLSNADGAYLVGNGKNKYTTVTADADLSSDAAKWKFVTEEEILAEMDDASSANPVDVSILISNPNFRPNGNGVTTVSDWTATDVTVGSYSGSYVLANAAEAYNKSSFSISQTITLPKVGYYYLSAQGFYRDNNNVGVTAQMYAGTTTVDLPARRTTADTMADAWAAFLEGSEPIDPIEIIADNEGATVEIGFSGTGATTGAGWVIFGEMTLMYYGETLTYAIGEPECSASCVKPGSTVTITFPDCITPTEGESPTLSTSVSITVGSTAVTDASLSYSGTTATVTFTIPETIGYGETVTVSVPAGLVEWSGQSVSSPTADVTFTLSTPPFEDQAGVYLYSVHAENFLSRGGEHTTVGDDTNFQSYGKIATTDPYGIPVDITFGDDGLATVKFLDSNLFLYGGGWAWTDGSEANAGKYLVKEVTTEDEETIYQFCYDGGDDSFLYVNDENYEWVANNGNLTGDNNLKSEIERTYWQIFTMKERDANKAAFIASQKAEIAEAVGADDLDEYIASQPTTDITFMVADAALAGSISGWDETDYYSDNTNDGVATYFTTNTNGTELYKGDAKLSQTVTGLDKGIYKVTLQGFVRQGSGTDIMGSGLDEYDLSIAFLEANGYQINLQPWATECSANSEGTGYIPDGMSNAFTDGRTYANELYTYVDSEGTLELSINCPDVLSAGWMMVKNLTLTYYGEMDIEDDCDYAKGDEATVNGTIYTVVSNNMFVNGGFNYGMNGWTAGGYTTAADPDNFDIQSEGGYNGGEYLVASSGGTSSEKTPSQAIAVEEGKTYLFVGYTSGKTPDSGNLRYSALFEMSDATTEASHDEDDGKSYSNTIIQLEWAADPGETSSTWTQTIGVFEATTDYVGMRMGWSTGSYDGFQLYEVEATGVEWEMTSAGWGTLILPFDVEAVPSGLTMYAGDALSLDSDGTTITVSTAAESIAANTPYLVSGTAGTYSFTGTPVEAESLTLGMLTGTLVDMTYSDFTPNSGQYVLQDHDEEGGEGLAFYLITTESSDVTLTANHCYLTSSVTPTALHLPGMATAIEAVESDVIANDAIYDLSGRRVSKAVKGVYIQNGKKVLVK